jgi:hypothetical protein
MPRTFTAADIIQGADGQPGALDVVTVSLPAPAIEGNGGIIVMGAQTDISPPRQWHPASRAGFTAGSHQVAIMCRPYLQAGEQSWDFQTNSSDPVNPGGVAFWLWRVEEWSANLSPAAVLGDAATFNATPSLASISTGTTEAWDPAECAVGIAAVLMLGNAGGAVFPTVGSWSNGFTETDMLTEGTGSQGDDLRLWVARKYGDPGDTGAWETTATFSGTVTGKTPMAALAVFRAAYYEGEV